ncbi:MAG: hypothetical protein IKJ80_04630 [Clostridia bacterium]|nr:hypothetical protein [Clostridia bacterium]
MKKIISTSLLVCMLILALSSCGGGITVSESQIKSALYNETLEEDECELTFEGSSDDVSAFTLVVHDINASKIKDRERLKKVIDTLYEDSMQLSWKDLRMCNAYLAVVEVCGLFIDKETFDANAFIETALDIICEGQSEIYENWTVSASVSIEDDSITIRAVSK